MSSTAKLLERWMKARGLTTQTAAAAALGTKPSTVNNWLRGVSQAAPAYIGAMADDLGEDAGGWVLLIESERARDAADRKALAAMAKKLGVAAAIALCAIGSAIPLNLQAGIQESAYYVAAAVTAVTAWACGRLSSRGLSAHTRPRRSPWNLHLGTAAGR